MAVSAIVAVRVLLLLAVPLLSHPARLRRLRQLPRGHARSAARLRPLAEGFGPGYQRAAFVTVEGDTAHRPSGARRRSPPRWRAPRTSRSPSPTPIDDDLALVIVYPQTAPQDEATTKLVDDLRDDVIPATGVDAKVGGFTAASTDFAEYLGGRMPLLIGVVLRSASCC